MPSILDPEVLSRLEARLSAVRPDAARRWGTMGAAAMLCHVADGFERVLGRAGGPPGVSRPLRKWVALRSGLPWPRGAATVIPIDPLRDAARVAEIESNRARAIAGLRAIAKAAPEAFPASHALFGAMTPSDSRHWAYRHADHHLRQFGL